MELHGMRGMTGADKSAVLFVAVVAIFLVLAALRVGAAEYDYLVSGLTSDGRGYVDTGYRYHCSDSQKTKRIVLKLFNSSNGYKKDVTGMTCDWFGVFGNGGQRHSYFRFHPDTDNPSMEWECGGKVSVEYSMAPDKDGQPGMWTEFRPVARARSIECDRSGYLRYRVTLHRTSQAEPHFILMLVGASKHTRWTGGER